MSAANICGVCALLSSLATIGSAQSLPPVTLDIELQSSVVYHPDDSEYSQRATVPNVIPFIDAKNFSDHISINDIISVNGRPAKGALVFTFREAGLTPTPQPGQAIADVQRSGAVTNFTIELLDAGGQPVGTLVGAGLSGGLRPPGAPLTQIAHNIAIVGGTGAFLGARGQVGLVRPGARSTSGQEDPSLRRVHAAGNPARPGYIVQFFPHERPAIVETSTGYSVFHADFTPVSSTAPVAAGEVLVIRAKGLGPTLPGLNPGAVHQADALQEVSSPVEVLINGEAVPALVKVGWPGTADEYRVDVRVPNNLAAGTATLRLQSAWLPGPEIRGPVRP